ncbi:uncharacterized protein [Nicotiana tomentosiformis]|uniref:uncharacterized protein n=1 Tax=Nicotiana tomentosiformis TaxID=4098 RepID=UPI00388C5BA6
MAMNFSANSSHVWMECLEEQPTSGGEHTSWIDSQAEAASLIWTQFSDIFLTEYVPQSLRDVWRAEFEQLRRGSMTVSEYAVWFSDLSRHAPALVTTVRERVRRFIEGLLPSIRFSMARELEMDITYQQVVVIARRLEGMRTQEREEREAKRPQDSRTYNSSCSPATARQGRGYMGRSVHSALPATSSALTTTRPQDPYYALPVSSVPPVCGASSGQSNRSGQSQSQQPRPPSAYFEYGDTRYLVRDCPRFRRGAPLQTTQALRVPPGPQAMITAPVATPPTQPARGGGRTGLPRLEWRGFLYYVPSRVVSFLKAQRMVEIGCDVYLAYVRDVSVDTPTVELVPVVRDYSNVFQRRWLELLKDYDITVLYYPEKVNVVADSLSRKAESLGSLAYLPVAERPLALDVQALANQFVKLDVSEPSRVLAGVVSQSSLYNHIRERQYDDPHLLVLKDTIQHGDAKKSLLEMMHMSRDADTSKPKHAMPYGFMLTKLFDKLNIALPELKFGNHNDVMDVVTLK